MKKFLRTEEASEYLGIKKGTLLKLTMKKEITHYKPNRLLYFLKEDLDKYIKSKKIQGSIKLNNPERKERIIEKTEKWISAFCNTGNDNE